MEFNSICDLYIQHADNQNAKYLYVNRELKEELVNQCVAITFGNLTFWDNCIVKINDDLEYNQFYFE